MLTFPILKQHSVKTMKQNYETLPWNFEAFRNFISFEVLQQAASVLCLFEGEDIFSNDYQMERFEYELSIRTGVEWLPKRNIDADIHFNAEGNLFRNKARVFTSFYLIDLSCLIERSKLALTPFCKALGTGKLDGRKFYNEIICRFEYPHPAYEENWSKWNAAGIAIKPLVLMLEILIQLYEIKPSESYFTVSEFASFAHPRPFYSDTKSIAKSILEFRTSGEKVERQRSDEVDRKIGDIIGFLCMTGYTYYHGNKIFLNLIDVHPTEKVYFYEKRGEVNTKIQIQNVIKDGKARG